MIDLAHPAFIAWWCTWAGPGRGFLRTPSMYTIVSPDHRAGMAEYRRARDRRGLRPLVFLRVVHLDVVHRVGLRPSTHKVDVTIAIDPGDRIVHCNRQVFGAEPAIGQGFVHVDVGQSGPSALPIDHVAAEKKHVLPGPDRRRRQTPHGAGDRVHLGPFSGVRVERVGGIADRVPGFLRPHTHQRVDQQRCPGFLRW